MRYLYTFWPFSANPAASLILISLLQKVRKRSAPAGVFHCIGGTTALLLEKETFRMSRTAKFRASRRLAFLPAEVQRL